MTDDTQALFPQIDEPYVSEVYKNFSTKGWLLAMKLRIFLGLGLTVWLFILTSAGLLHLLWPLIFAILGVVGWISMKIKLFQDWQGYVLVALETVLLTLLLFVPAGAAGSLNGGVFGIFLYLSLVALAAFSFNAEVMGWAVLLNLLGWLGGYLMSGQHPTLSMLASPAMFFIVTGGLMTGGMTYLRHLVCRQLIAEREYYTLLNAELENAKQQEPDKTEYIDRLTGLGTRAAFDRDSKLFTNIFAEGRLNDLTIAFIDIENPTNLIKEHGHQEYKRMLRSFAQSSRKKFRSSDMVYRFSSDQFVLLAPGSTMLNADRLRTILKSVSDEVVQDGFTGFKASMGISTLAEVDIEREQSLQNLPEIEGGT